MPDPHLTWLLLLADNYEKTQQRLAEMFGPREADLFMLIAVWAPVIENAGYFEPHPNPAHAGKRDWRWIIAARMGVADYSPRAFDVRNALYGRDVYDLVACTPDLSRVTGRLLGLIDVLGYPFESDWADAPVRVHATPLGWLRARCRGIVPVGSEIAVQDWLRHCAPGLIGDSAAHCEALLMKMRRELPPLPKLFQAG